MSEARIVNQDVSGIEMHGEDGGMRKAVDSPRQELKRLIADPLDAWIGIDGDYCLACVFPPRDPACCDYDPIAYRDFIVRACNSHADLLAALKATEDLCVRLCTVAMNPAVRDHLPYGLLEDAATHLVNSCAHTAVRKAEGRE